MQSIEQLIKNSLVAWNDLGFFAFWLRDRETKFTSLRPTSVMRNLPREAVKQ